MGLQFLPPHESQTKLRNTAPKSRDLALAPFDSFIRQESTFLFSLSNKRNKMGKVHGSLARAGKVKSQVSAAAFYCFRRRKC